MAEAISLAKELNDTNALAVALCEAADLGHYEYQPREVEHFASDLIGLSTRHNFSFFLAVGGVLLAWARSFTADSDEAIKRIEEGIADYQATGSMLNMSYLLTLKSEAMYHAGRILEALDAVREAQAMVERCQETWWCAEMHRLRAVFLFAMGAHPMQIEASFSAAIRTATEQKALSLAKRAKATYAKYHRLKKSASGKHGFRLPLV